jgi:MSHA biogenesis protein MshP
MSWRRVTPARGLGAIAAVIILVLLSALAAAIVRLGTAQQQGQALEVQSARAAQAVHAGLQWAQYQALKGGWMACAGATTTLDLRADTGLYVTLTCQSSTYGEGESAPGAPRTVRVYTLDAVACNSSTCPDNARGVTPGYVERRRQVQLSDG